MSNAPLFRLHSVLILTAIVAFALLALVRPSVVWLVLLPPLVSMVSVFAVVRAITMPRERMFWTSLMAGVVTFALSVIFIELLSAMIGGQPTVSQSVGKWAWQLIHADAPLAQPGGTRLPPPEFASFVVSLYIIFAVLFSASATVLAQLLMRERNQDSS